MGYPPEGGKGGKVGRGRENIVKIKPCNMLVSCCHDCFKAISRGEGGKKKTRKKKKKLVLVIKVSSNLASRKWCGGLFCKQLAY